VVHRHGGEVDKFMGDALLAVFYASGEGRSPTSTCLQAAACALEMRDRLRELNERRVARQQPPLEIGAGITYGEIIAGPIGSPDRMDFTVIGTVVNQAARVEKLSKLGRHTRILFNEAVEEKVRGLLDCERVAGGPADAPAAFELVRVRALEDLVSMLESEDAPLRRRALELLGQSRNPGAREPILAALNDPDDDTRVAAAGALARVADTEDRGALDALFGRLRAEGSARVASALIAAAGRLCRSERILELGRFLESPDERIVANVVEALGQVRTPNATDLVLPLLASRNNRVKANAAMALFAAGRVEVLGTLKPMLMHSDPLMRASAAFAIGELSILVQREDLFRQWQSTPGGVKVFLGELQECVPMLVALLKDPDPAVKRQAIGALGKIRDRSAVLPMLESLDLEAESRDTLRDFAQALQSIGAHRLVREVVAGAARRGVS
jgi:class 3 adenylate cyclase